MNQLDTSRLQSEVQRLQDTATKQIADARAAGRIDGLMEAIDLIEQNAEHGSGPPQTITPGILAIAQRLHAQGPQAIAQAKQDYAQTSYCHGINAAIGAIFQQGLRLGVCYHDWERS